MNTAAAVAPAEKRTVRPVPSVPRSRPGVTVLVTSYNYARYLPDCAASVLGQRDVDVRLIVVDDGSTDDTPAVTARLADDPRVTIIRNDPNRGHIPSVNRGFALVETDFVVKLDADDLLAAGALARATALLEAEPDVTFVYGRPNHFTGPAPDDRDGPAKTWTVWQGREWLEQRCLSGFNAISQPEVVIRTEALRPALPIREDLPHTSDLHLWMQLAAMGSVGRVNGPAQGHYRVHDASMQRTVHGGILFDMRARRRAFDAVFAAQAGALPGAAELHDVARRSLAAGALDRACRAYDRGKTTEEPVEDYVEFALETWPQARDLPQWAALERRRAIGAARAPRHPRFFLEAVQRRAGEELMCWRWRRTGEMLPWRWLPGTRP